MLLGTLYPLVTEAFGTRVSVGPPYFNPVGAIFALPMLVVMAVGPLLRWRGDRAGRVAKPMVLPALAVVAVLAALLLLAPGIGILPLLGLALSAGLAIASVLPLFGRNLRRTPLPVWGMVVAHLGLAVAVAGMASESAFSTERLVAANIGDSVEVGPWTIDLAAIDPVAGPNWTALQADMQASYAGGEPITLHPQSRTFTSPVQTTSESALATRWNGQLYAVLGVQGEDGRWQLRLWWKPFVPLIWLGGLLVAFGGALALVGRVASGWRRQSSMRRIAERREAKPLPRQRAPA